MEAVSNLLQSGDNGIYSEFSVENILQNLQEESKREEYATTTSEKVESIVNTEIKQASCKMQSSPMKENNSIDSHIHPSDNALTNYEQAIELQLCEAKLWNSFHKHTNEMILTKSGRRMFPVIKVKINGLNPDGMFTVKMDFVPRDSRRWKFVSGKWTQCAKCETTNTSFSYTHPDSPNYGSHWMKGPIAFSKIKLSNRETANSQVITLQSLHKYIPRIRVTRVNGNEEEKTVLQHSFEQTEFIAVTAYQNEEITSLKIRHNPFAKAFLDAKLNGKKQHIDAIDSRVTMATQNNSEYFNKHGFYDYYPTLPCNYHSPSHIPQRFYQYYPHYDVNSEASYLTHQPYAMTDFQANLTSPYSCRNYRMSPYPNSLRKISDIDETFILPERVVSPSVSYNFSNGNMQYHV